MRSTVLIPLRVLFLRSSREDYLAFNWRHFAFGLFVTWLVGMGRHWDNPRVEMPLSLGVGSLVYVFVLAAVLFIVGWPFRDENWTYGRILTLVVLTAPPAAIYALPVERWGDFDTARTINVWFLVVVATWRVAIWGRFVWLMCPAGEGARVSVFFAPLTAISVSLVLLNLERVVVDFMSGLHPPPEGTTADAAYLWLIILTGVSLYLVFPIVAISYIISWILHVKNKKVVKTSAAS